MIKVSKSKNKILSTRIKKMLKFKKSKKDKQETYIFIRKVYKFLKLHPNHILFKKLYGLAGQYDYETQEITLDPRKDLISTLIHELAHHIHLDWSETKVINYEHRIMNNLSPRQISNIIKILGKSI